MGRAANGAMEVEDRPAGSMTASGPECLKTLMDFIVVEE